LLSFVDPVALEQQAREAQAKGASGAGGGCTVM